MSIEERKRDARRRTRASERAEQTEAASGVQSSPPP